MKIIKTFSGIFPKSGIASETLFYFFFSKKYASNMPSNFQSKCVGKYQEYFCSRNLHCIKGNIQQNYCGGNGVLFRYLQGSSFKDFFRHSSCAILIDRILSTRKKIWEIPKSSKEFCQISRIISQEHSDRTSQAVQFIYKRGVDYTILIHLSNHLSFVVPMLIIF